MSHGGYSILINTPINLNLNPSSVAPFPSVGQRRQNRTSTAISRQPGGPFDWSIMLPPRRKVRIREGRPRESEARRSPRRQDAARPLGGGFKCTEMGLRFRASKARKPLPSLEESRETFRARKVSRAAFFSYFSLQKQRKVHPNPNDIAETTFSIHPNKN